MMSLLCWTNLNKARPGPAHNSGGTVGGLMSVHRLQKFLMAAGIRALWLNAGEGFLFLLDISQFLQKFTSCCPLEDLPP